MCFWTKIYTIRSREVTGLIYYKGKFYYVTWNGQIWFFEVAGSRVRQPIVGPRFLIWHREDVRFNQGAVRYYLVELSGALLFVCRYSCGKGCQTYKFKVCELDVTNGHLDEIDTLRDSALFLGFNKSHSFDSSRFIGVKPNYIYFTDDWYEEKDMEYRGGRDMRAYNLEDGSIEAFYVGSSVCCLSPPMWVTPSI
ncbi:hypothetical protein R3W88_021852 [Solanum pinnatisectum]|uniref:KIB1-4 beta-propeller domain-containing protein n=1 Tax=Solanum pinnatisectum TaxID=50273 RepID=A0AAV9LV08_9SOLN|nr:hypothetical protein R3W88_021852 [Solanum pinnatisectum]